MLMVEIRKTELFAKWIDNLRDVQAKARVLVRIERLASGNAGDVKPVGEGISEMRIDYGPGYRGRQEGRCYLFIYCPLFGMEFRGQCIK